MSGQPEDYEREDNPATDEIDTRLTDRSGLKGAMRIFTEGEPCNELPPKPIEWKPSTDGTEQEDETQIVYTDQSIAGPPSQAREGVLATFGTIVIAGPISRHA